MIPKEEGTTFRCECGNVVGRKVEGKTSDIFKKQNYCSECGEKMNWENKETRGTKRVSKTEKHKNICDELNRIYRNKNKDYGDSFTKSFEKYGLTSSAIRLGDKFYRFENLINEAAWVKDESVEDTLMDMANYCIMTLIEIDETKKAILQLDKELKRVGELTSQCAAEEVTEAANAIAESKTYGAVDTAEGLRL